MLRYRWMATPSIESGTAAAKEILPLVSQYGLAAALLLISALFFATVWFMGRHLVQLSRELSAMVKVNEVQAKVQEGMAKQLERLPLIMAWLAVVTDRMQIKLPPAPGGEG